MSERNETSGAALGAEPSAGNEREPIAVFGLDGVVEGWIAKPEGRISDGLNNADLPVGADPRRYVGSTGGRWLPLTECTVSDAGGDWSVDVVIVNLDHATRRETSQSAPKFG